MTLLARLTLGTKFSDVERRLRLVPNEEDFNTVDQKLKFSIEKIDRYVQQLLTLEQRPLRRWIKDRERKKIEQFIAKWSERRQYLLELIGNARDLQKEIERELLERQDFIKTGEQQD